MTILSERIAQADDPIYKSGLVMSFHRELSESTLDMNELNKSLNDQEDLNTLNKEKEVSAEESSS